MNAAEIQVRTRTLREFGVDVPETARVMFEVAAQRGWPSLSFAVPAVAPSTNHMYTQVSRERRVLSAETMTFRQMVNLAIGHRRHDWKPSGQVSVLVFLAQPYWLTKKRTIRESDADNRLKALLDAVQLATGVPDQTNWEVHCWKIVTTRRVSTIVYCFDQGDVVDVYL